MQNSSLPDIAQMGMKNHGIQWKKGANYLLFLGALIILLKFVIATQIFIDILQTDAPEEIYNLAWYTYMDSVLTGFFQGSVLIGLGLIYNRM